MPLPSPIAPRRHFAPQRPERGLAHSAQGGARAAPQRPCRARPDAPSRPREPRRARPIQRLRGWRRRGARRPSLCLLVPARARDPAPRPAPAAAQAPGRRVALSARPGALAAIGPARGASPPVVGAGAARRRRLAGAPAPRRLPRPHAQHHRPGRRRRMRSGHWRPRGARESAGGSPRVAAAAAVATVATVAAAAPARARDPAPRPAPAAAQAPGRRVALSARANVFEALADALESISKHLQPPPRGAPFAVTCRSASIVPIAPRLVLG